MKIITSLIVLIISIQFCYSQERTNPNLKQPKNQNTPSAAEPENKEKELTDEEKQRMIDEMNNGTTKRTKAQRPTNSNSNNDSTSKWQIGGNFGLNFGTNTNIVIGPSIGYQFTDYLIGGVNLGYTYSSFQPNNSTGIASWKSNLFNAGVFLQPMINNIFFIANYNFFTGTRKYDESTIKDVDINENTLWLGGGYRARIGGNVFTTFGVQYNVLHNDDSIFGGAWQPVVGINAGF